VGHRVHPDPLVKPEPPGSRSWGQAGRQVHPGQADQPGPPAW
jgi:hypothetical protein